MTEVWLALDAFHFLRPWLLVLLPLVLWLWWRVRDHGRGALAQTDGLADHLREALTLGRDKRGTWQPIDGVTLALIFVIVGAAGPTWSRVPDPFLAQTAPLVVVLKVTPSMDNTDVAPTRLERGKQKVRDLLDLRAGARTGLVAYAGSAHRVVPLTEDAGIMRPYLEGLTTEIMPSAGENAAAAFELASAMLAEEATPGAVLFVTDGLNTADTALIAPTDQVSLAFLSMLPEGQRDQGLDAVSGPPVISVQPGDADVRQLDRVLNAAFRRAMLEDESQQWDDRARWLAWPAAVLVLLWFRRGWTMQWLFLLALTCTFNAPSQARADGIADWFFTPDQQGRLAFQRKDFNTAAERFVDPLWKGYAFFRSARYPEAIEALERLDTAEATYIRAIAHLRNRQYRDGVRAFERVLELDPDYPGAAENLDVAKRIVTFVEDTQAQSDTGEESGIGADEVVFDNESGRGAETEITDDQAEGPQILSTEQWMNSFNTQTGDFLRQRFLLEANTQ
ncbi:MAG: VWA domain-containing protein [Pseudomonadota bacterium]